MSAPELKPCPFCGSNNVVRFRHVALQPEPCIMCRDCCASVTSVSRWNRRADLPPTDAEIMAHPKVKALVEASGELSSIIEGIQGAFNHGTWRDEKNGMRLKDTNEWVTFYVALAAIQEAKQ